MPNRVRAVIIKNGKILLIRRMRNGREYFVFPGGRVKEKENFESAIKREIKAEFDIEIEIKTFMFRLENKGRVELYFLVNDFEGEPKISGERRQIIDESNQYYLEWKNLGELKKLSNLRPAEAKKRIENLIISSGSKVKVN